MKIKRFYVQNTITDKTRTFQSLAQAVHYCIAKDDTDLIIHIGSYNLDYYKKGDTYTTLYSRCKGFLNELK